MSKRIMISTGEASGELYGALLSRAIKKIWPDTEIFGLGGDRMKEEGIQIIAPISSVLGLTETIKHWGEVIKSYKKAKEALVKQNPDILIVIDYPDFNLALAKKAKSAGIPVLYYVSPQVWAWRKRRIKKIASLVNKIAVLFPFEVDLYKKTGLPCEFVGHPISETLNISRTKEEIRKKLGFDPGKKVVTLLPGSRPSEVQRHSSLLWEIAEKFHKEFPDIQVVVPLVSGTELREELPGYVRVLHGHTSEAIACSEATAVASGTATLETALLGIPMVVFYKVSFLTSFLAKRLVKVRFISLVNILSGKEVVVELLQENATSENIFSELKKILSDIGYRQGIISQLQNIKEVMGRKTASIKVASMIGELAGWNSTNA